MSRVLPAAELEQETLEYAEQVAANDPAHNRLVKFAINQAMDAGGFSQSVRAVGVSFITRPYPEATKPGAPPPAAQTFRPAGLDLNGSFKDRIQRALAYFRREQARAERQQHEPENVRKGPS